MANSSVIPNSAFNQLLGSIEDALFEESIELFSADKEHLNSQLRQVLSAINITVESSKYAALHIDQLRSAETNSDTFVPKLFASYSEAVDAIWQPIAKRIVESMPDHFLESYLGLPACPESQLSENAKTRLDAYDSDAEKIAIIDWYVPQHSDEDFLSFYFIKEISVSQPS